MVGSCSNLHPQLGMWCLFAEAHDAEQGPLSHKGKYPKLPMIGECGNYHALIPLALDTKILYNVEFSFSLHQYEDVHGNSGMGFHLHIVK